MLFVGIIWEYYPFISGARSAARCRHGSAGVLACETWERGRPARVFKKNSGRQPALKCPVRAWHNSPGQRRVSAVALGCGKYGIGNEYKYERTHRLENPACDDGWYFLRMRGRMLSHVSQAGRPRSHVRRPVRYVIWVEVIGKA